MPGQNVNLIIVLDMAPINRAAPLTLYWWGAWEEQQKIKHTHTCSISLETRWMQSGKSLTCAFLRPRSKILILASGTARTNRERGYGLFLQYLVGIAQRPVKSLVVSATAVLRASCSVQTKPAQTRASTLPQNNASKTNL